MTEISGNWMTDPGTLSVMEMLTDAGHEAYFVGGCVRDALLGRPISDIDIATNAKPEQVIDLARAARLKAIPTGVEHGTVTIIAGRTFEVTTYRRDVETDGRRAVVAFSDNLSEDAARRDLTINGLYADTHGRVVDLVGGVEDLQARRIRFIGAARDRIREDYLRSLRYFRFYAWFGDTENGPDADALDAIAANLSGLDTVSKERVGSEMLKLLSAPDPAAALAVMDQTGALRAILPGADPKSIGPLVHIEDGLLPDPIRRLVALTGDDPTDCLRLSRDQAKTWKTVSNAARNGMGGGEAGYRLGEQRGCDAVLVGAALMGASIDAGELEAVQTGATANFPVSAADLAPLSGSDLGRKLKELEARWIASDFQLSKDSLLA